MLNDVQQPARRRTTSWWALILLAGLFVVSIHGITGGNVIAPIGQDQETGSISQVYDDHGTLLVGTDNGLYRRDGDSLVPIGQGQETGWISQIYDDHGTLLVGARTAFIAVTAIVVPIGKLQGTGRISQSRRSRHAADRHRERPLSP